MNYTDASTTRYTLPIDVQKITDISSMLKLLLPIAFKGNITIDDIRQKSTLTNKNTLG